MGVTKRAQVLMEPVEYRRLEEIARVRHVSVGELIRLAVRRAYLSGGEDGASVVDAISAMEIPVGEWEDMEREILEGYDARLP